MYTQNRARNRYIHVSGRSKHFSGRYFDFSFLHVLQKHAFFCKTVRVFLSQKPWNRAKKKEKFVTRPRGTFLGPTSVHETVSPWFETIRALFKNICLAVSFFCITKHVFFCLCFFQSYFIINSQLILNLIESFINNLISIIKNFNNLKLNF